VSVDDSGPNRSSFSSCLILVRNLRQCLTTTAASKLQRELTGLDTAATAVNPDRALSRQLLNTVTQPAAASGKNSSKQTAV
jgi:hypothetical protein